MWGGGESANVKARWDRSEAHARAAWVLAVDLAANATGADGRAVVQHHTGRRGRTVDNTTALARKIACYLACTVADVSADQLSRANGLDRATIRRHTLWVEEKRDEPLFDRTIENLEGTLLETAARVVLRRLGDAERAA
jgi:hypothetical protein